MESEQQLRQWALYKDGRIKIEAIQAWALLRTGLCHEVRQFNREFEKAGKDVPLSMEDGEALIIIRKEQYPFHETQIMLELPQRAFILYRKSAPDGVTEPVETDEVVNLDLGSDDKLYLAYNNKRYGAFQLPHEIMKEVIKACK